MASRWIRLSAPRARLFAPFALVAAASCSGPDGTGATEANTQARPLAYKAPGARPVPKCAGNASCWKGNAVELLVADTYAECAHDSNYGQNPATGTGGQWAISDGAPHGDPYLEALVDKMHQADCDGVASTPILRTVAGWIHQRKLADCNTSGTQVLNPLSGMIPSQSIFATYPHTAELCDSVTAAVNDQALFTQAALNSCLAMRLRAIAPGSAGGEALLLSGAEQRELLEVVRERAQVGMLAYSQIFAAFSSAPPETCGPDTNPIQVLSHWASRPESAPLRSRMAADFAATVQLHTEATQDLLSLMARSASARAERGLRAPSLPEEDWGPGSWRHRALALLHGGDPLATAGGASWAETVPVSDPWPSRDQIPFVSTLAREPQVAQFRRMARECDVQDLVVDHGTCMTPLIEQSGDRMYRSVEACLRHRECTELTNAGTCAPQFPAAIPANTYDDEFLLWKRYRIRPEHARTSAAILAESLKPLCLAAGGAPMQAGAYSIDGTIGLGTDPPFAQLYGGFFVHLDRDAKLRPRPTAHAAPLFGSFHDLPAAAVLFPSANAAAQGFDIWTFGLEKRRLAGASSSLAAVRSGIVDAQLQASAYVPENASQVLAMISGAIGDTQVGIRPTLYQYQDALGQAYDTADSSLYFWNIEVLAPSNDSFFSTPSADLAFAFVYDNPWVAGLADASSTASAFGFTMDGLMAQAFWGWGATVQDVSGTNLRRIRMDVPAPTWGGRWTLVAQRTVHGDPETGTPSHYEYRTLIANQLLPDPSNPETLRAGFFVADGGTLGTEMTRMMRPDDTDPATPATDAFGLPTRWVPPTTPNVLPAGDVPTNATAYYLEKAKLAASEATASVTSAMDGIVQETADEAAMNAAAIKAKAVTEEGRKSLCGDGNAKCDLSTQNTQLVVSDLWPTAPTCNVSKDVIHSCVYTGSFCDGLNLATISQCIARETLEQAAISVPVAKAVWDHRNEPTPPSFSEYSGGTVQTIFLEQWNDLKEIKSAGDEVVLSVKLAEAKLNAMESALAAINNLQETAECDNTAKHSLIAPLQSGLYKTLGRGGTGIPLGAVGSVFGPAGGAVGSVLDSDGGEKERKEAEIRCAQYALQYGQEVQHIVITSWETIAAMTARSRSFLQSVVNIRLHAAKLEQAKNEVKLASARAQLDADLIVATGGLKTQYGIYRRYHQYDLWRAKALLEAARVQAVIARRAIEASLLVDLSTMVKDEPLVAKPSTWADSIYEYDLDIPAAVGLSVSTPQAGGLYANKLTDYVANLEKFVLGFPIARPTAVAQSDAELLSVPGPAAKLPTPPSGPALSDPLALSWQVFCIDEWRNFDSPSNPCGSESQNVKPQRARVMFSVDPWGRVGGTVTNEPFSKRYNARWGKLAVNLVGTGILDCQKAKDPAGCYSQSFLRYDLTHLGPAWTRNYDQEWRFLGMPTGRIEAGKALAAEEWLDPVANGWAKPFVGAVARSEYRERPFDGTYMLELTLGPEARVDRIERVQVLTDATYWVKQQ